MSRHNSVALIAAIVVALAWVVGCSSRSQESADGGGAGIRYVHVDGSSTVYPITEAVAEEFQREKRGAVRVTVGISGTGGGFKKFGRGETDVTNASRPILQEEMELAKTNGIEYIELPVCFDALTVIIHPENDWAEEMTIEELKRMWEPSAQGVIMRWNQIRPDWPDEQLVLFGAGTDSGTWDYFTEAVVGEAKASRGDFTASEDDNVTVQGVAGNRHALGFLGYSYFPPNADKLKAVAVDWEEDDLGPIGPSLESVLEGTYNPLSRPLFIYASRQSAERPEVQEFVEFYLENAAELGKEVGYVPLPADAYEMARTRFRERQVGTGFGGVPEVGLPIGEILDREPKM